MVRTLGSGGTQTTRFMLLPAEQTIALWAGQMKMIPSRCVGHEQGASAQYVPVGAQPKLMH